MKNKKSIFNVAIIGCGKIGYKRANALTSKGKLLACSDKNYQNAKKLAKKYKATPYKNWIDIMGIAEIDIVIICTYHNTLSVIAKEAIKAKKNVLIEKPGALNSK